MKSFIPAFLAIFTLLTGCEPDVKRVESKPAAPDATTNQASGGSGASQNSGGATSAGAKRGNRVTCHQCNGEGYVMVRSNTKAGDSRLSCPTCAGRGGRELVVPDNKVVCPDCKGMGIFVVAGARGATSLGTACQRCAASGVVNK